MLRQMRSCCSILTSKLIAFPYWVERRSIPPNALGVSQLTRIIGNAFAEAMALGSVRLHAENLNVVTNLVA